MPCMPTPLCMVGQNSKPQKDKIGKKCDAHACSWRRFGRGRALRGPIKNSRVFVILKKQWKKKGGKYKDSNARLQLAAFEGEGVVHEVLPGSLAVAHHEPYPLPQPHSPAHAHRAAALVEPHQRPHQEILQASSISTALLAVPKHGTHAALVEPHQGGTWNSCGAQ